ncbi:hypothetical protein EV363DRAFT_1296825 [Boletus edulis]|nr:hypothetical protein EV363DRAFT_1296825 [Boletus edulis]
MACLQRLKEREARNKFRRYKVSFATQMTNQHESIPDSRNKQCITSNVADNRYEVMKGEKIENKHAAARHNLYTSDPAICILSQLSNSGQYCGPPEPTSIYSLTAKVLVATCNGKFVIDTRYAMNMRHSLALRGASAATTVQSHIIRGWQRGHNGDDAKERERKLVEQHGMTSKGEFRVGSVGEFAKKVILKSQSRNEVWLFDTLQDTHAFRLERMRLCAKIGGWAEEDEAEKDTSVGTELERANMGSSRNGHNEKEYGIVRDN